MVTAKWLSGPVAAFRVNGSLAAHRFPRFFSPAVAMAVGGYPSARNHGRVSAGCPGLNLSGRFKLVRVGRDPVR